jgi:hypothetical protein
MDAERGGYFGNIYEAHIPLAPFNTANVATIKLAAECKSFLRQSVRPTELPKARAESPLYVVPLGFFHVKRIRTRGPPVHGLCVPFWDLGGAQRVFVQLDQRGCSSSSDCHRR